MKIYKINIDLKNKIWEWLKTNNIANRGEFDGNKENQLVGLIGEYEVHNLLLGYYPEFKNGFDGGIDIIYKNKSMFYEKGEKRYRDDGTFFILKTDTYEIYNYNLIDTKYINEI